MADLFCAFCISLSKYISWCVPAFAQLFIISVKYWKTLFFLILGTKLIDILQLFQHNCDSETATVFIF